MGKKCDICYKLFLFHLYSIACLSLTVTNIQLPPPPPPISKCLFFVTEKKIKKLLFSCGKLITRLSIFWGILENETGQGNREVSSFHQGPPHLVAIHDNQLALWTYKFQFSSETPGMDVTTHVNKLDLII